VVDIRTIAGRHFQQIINRDGWPATVTDPDGNVCECMVLSNDIGQVIDSETGMIVSGRTASATVVTADLIDAEMGRPVAIVDETLKPWTIVFNDIQLAAYTFKVAQTMPDRTIGGVVCMLEEYTP
jgi:hypothetical protein